MLLSKQQVVLAAAVVLLLEACGPQRSSPVAEFLRDDRAAAVFIFLAPDCPLSQNYTLTLKNLREQFHEKGIEFYGVFTDETGVDEFVKTYDLGFPVVVDREFRLAGFFGATITPEVFAVDAGGHTVYKGAVDNWVPELGQHRTVITEHYLLDALNSLVNHKDIHVKETQAVGCFIER